MALKTYTKQTTLASGFVLKLTVTENSIGTSSQNYSNCTATLQLIVDSGASISMNYHDFSLSGDVSASGGGGAGSYSAGTHTLLTKNYTKQHNNDGTGSTSVTGTFYVTSPSLYGNITAGGALTTIAREFTTKPTFSFQNLSETSVRIKWNTSENCDRVDYNISGTSVQNAWTGNAKTGTIDITGLNTNQQYSIYIWCRRKDSQVGTTSDTQNFKTYQYPYVDSITTTNLKIGNSQKVNLYNPLGRNITVYMKQNNTSGTTLYSDTTTSTSLTFTPNTTTLNNSIPNSTSGNAVYYCTYSSQTSGTKSGTYYIDNSGGTYNPTFDATNWSYSANYTSLTNNHPEVVISEKSTITFSVDTSATAKNGATITSYKVEWGNKSDTISGTTGSTTLTGGTSNILKITAIDSRGFNTPSQLDLGDNFISYFKQTLSGTTEREDGIGTDTKLSFSGQFFNDKFGTNGVQNTIESVKYYTSTDNATWSNAYTIPTSSITTSENNYSLSNYNIHLDGSSGGFPIGTRYYVKVDIEDKMQTQSFTGILVADGKIAVDCYQDSNGDYHRGINGLGADDCNQLINGNERVTQSIMIPKNSSDGYGLCNSDGASIIRDYANQNVTVDATGKILFLGWSNTTGINFLHNAATIDANGDYSGSAAKWNGIVDEISTANTTATYVPVYVSGKMQHTERAIWNSKQHTNYNTNQDYLATLSTLSYWNGAYNSGGSSNLTYAHQGEIQCKSTQLYNNTNGSNGTITLSASSANYTYLDIYFLFGATEGPYKGTVYGFTRVYSPSGKVVSLGGHWVYNSSNGATQTVTKQILINTNKITNKSYSAFNVQNGASGVSSYSNAILITRVEGWK